MCYTSFKTIAFSQAILFSKFTKCLALHTRNFTKSLEILGNSSNPRVKQYYCEFTEIVSDFANFLSL